MGHQPIPVKIGDTPRSIASWLIRYCKRQNIKDRLKQLGLVIMVLYGLLLIYQRLIPPTKTVDLRIAFITLLLAVVIYVLSYLIQYPKISTSDSFRTMYKHEIDDFYLTLTHNAYGPTSTLLEKYGQYKNNPSSFKAIERYSPPHSGQPIARRTIEGYFVAYPLEKPTIDQLIRGNIRAPDIKPSLIVKPRGVTYGCYVSFIFGCDRKSKACAIACAKATLMSILKSESDEIVVVGRATTNDAVRLFKNYGFEVIDGGEIDLFSVCFKRLNRRDLLKPFKP